MKPQNMLTVAATVIAFVFAIFLGAITVQRLLPASILMGILYLLVSAKLELMSTLPVDRHFWIRRILEMCALCWGWVLGRFLI